MKKILSLIIAFILIFSCFAVAVCASDAGMWIEENEDSAFGDAYYDTQPVMTFSEDLQKFYVNDEPFSRVDTSMLTTDFGYEVNIVKEKIPWLKNSAFVDLNTLSEENIKNITIQTNTAKNMYLVGIDFNDGSCLIIHFLQDSYLEDYNNVVNRNADKYLIDFLYPSDNIVITNQEALAGEKLTLNKKELANVYEFSYVDKANKDLSISTRSGVVFILDKNHYYLDYKEAGIEDTAFSFCDWELTNISEEVPVHKITDEKLIADIKLALEKYYEDDFGLFYDKTASEIITAVFLIFIFAVIPAVTFVIFLIKAIRGKGIYKKLYITSATLCIAEIIVFIILAIIISPFTSLSSTDSETILGSSDSVSFVVSKITNIFW